jgi:hypothetical protein
VNPASTLVAVPAALVLLLGAAFSVGSDEAAGYTVDVDALPALAQVLLSDVEAVRAKTCPELPLVWLLAAVQAESTWTPHAYSSVGAAGLLQLLPGSWTEATGQPGWDVESGPGYDHPVFDPDRHLEAAIPWICGRLRTVSAHLRSTGKPTSPLDALAVCHIAGCSRVYGSTSGVPRAGEASCDQSCASRVQQYLETIHHWVSVYARPVPGIASVGGDAQRFTGTDGGCTVADPTGTGGCVTPAMAWLLQQTATAFPGLPVSCWDAHAWNPTSDHPRGKACDFTFGRTGRFPGPEDVRRGWGIARWFRANATALHVSYIIWQGHIWSVSRSDQGWRPYSGGGVYDPTSPTGGHYDHIHVSVR